MQYRKLGRTNLQVSVIAMGTNQLRRVPERDAIAALRRAFELGINFVNLEPEYEGADTLLATALQECEPAIRKQVMISVQAGGTPAEFERFFEGLCQKLQRERLDLFGISAISDQVAFGNNVWGRGGLVEFLQRKKEEGRVQGIFASDHGTPEQMRELLARDVFDALMLAYNPLGFHLVTFRAETVWQFERPPLPIENYRREDLPRTAREILPLAKARDIGIMLMKPLAGGMLCPGKAFPRDTWRESLPTAPSALAVLKYCSWTRP